MVWTAEGRRAGLVVLLLLTFLQYEPAAAARPAEAQVARCIRQAARGHAWLEKTLWGLRDQEAGWIGAEILNRDGSHDLGPLQINSWCVPKIAGLLSRREGEVRRWLQFDPCFNAQAARWIFLDALRTGGSYWQAVGIYHSPNGARQRRYAALVAVHLQRRFGADVFGRRGAAGMHVCVFASATADPPRPAASHWFPVYDGTTAGHVRKDPARNPRVCCRSCRHSSATDRNVACNLSTSDDLSRINAALPKRSAGVLQKTVCSEC